MRHPRTLLVALVFLVVVALVLGVPGAPVGAIAAIPALPAPLAKIGSLPLQFASTVAVAETGGVTTAVVGLIGGQGEARVYTGRDGVFALRAILVPGVAAEGFGESVAVAMDGTNTVVVVGAPDYRRAGAACRRGAAFVFSDEGDRFEERFMFTLAPPTDGAVCSDLGRSVAVAREGGTSTVAVGEPTRYGGPGAVHLLTGQGRDYAAQTLALPDGEPLDRFGASVAVRVAGGTTTLAVGAPGKVVGDERVPPGGNGAAYVATGRGGAFAWTRLLSEDREGDVRTFGTSVAVSVDAGVTTVAVGMPYRQIGADLFRGAVYVFRGGEGGYAQRRYLRDGGGAYDRFGTQVAVAVAGDAVTVVATSSPYYRSTFRGAAVAITDAGGAATQQDLGERVYATAAAGNDGGITVVTSASKPFAVDVHATEGLHT